MKRFLSVLLIIFTLTPALASCKGSEAVSDTSEGTGSYVENAKDGYETALGLLGEGKTEEAYYALRALKGDARAEEMLGDFILVYGKMTEKEDNGDSFSVEYEYDETGCLAKKTESEADGTTVSQYTYDARGNRIKTVEAYTSADESKKKTTVYDAEYDENGNRTSYTVTYDSGSSRRYVYTYDTNGSCVKEEGYDGKLGLIERNEYTYDANGNKTAEKLTSISPPKQSSAEFTYDEKNRLIKEAATDSYGVKTIEEHSYDENGNETKRILSSEAGKVISCTENTYDGNGRLLKKAVTNAYGRTEVTEYSYNDAGDLVREEQTDHDGKKDLTEIEYIYDDHGNVSRITKSYDGYKHETRYFGYRVFYKPNK